MDRAGALPVGNYALPNSIPVGYLYHELHDGVCGGGKTGHLIHRERPEIRSGKLPDSHIDLACQLGIKLPGLFPNPKSPVESCVLIPPQLHNKTLTRLLLTTRGVAPPDCR
jgi:hypothetical protein